MNELTTCRIGIDVGGTFTDFVIYNPVSRDIMSFKLPSTPDDPARAILNGLRIILPDYSPGHIQIIHGSTVATNALLEHKGAKTALITTRGFRDVLEIGRQNRPDLYKFEQKRIPVLVPKKYRLELDERLDYQGNAIQPINHNEIQSLIDLLRSPEYDDISSIAVCFLFSYANPSHEKAVTGKLRNLGYHVSASHEVLPEFREYERTSTTVVNAYVSPVMDRYLDNLEYEIDLIASELQTVDLQIMQSNGGMIDSKFASSHGVRCILSGPAGGIVGAKYIAEHAQGITKTENLQIITFDMGGTSTDVALIEGKPEITKEASIGGHPIAIPLLDIHTIGAGGGSIAYVDPGGSLRVGPQSAGATPGPACYGVGSEVTVTDANIVLGRMPLDSFLNGKMRLFPERSWQVMEKLGSELGLTPVQTALGIVKVINTNMDRAIRLVSIERGFDPREFSLISFGGAGGLHALELAEGLGIPRVLIPKHASTLSALGMIVSNVAKDYSQTVMLPGNTLFHELKQRFLILEEQAILDFMINGKYSRDEIQLIPTVDLRYEGQSFEIPIDFTPDFISTFHKEHHKLYGYHLQDGKIEIVTIRLQAVVLTSPPQVQHKQPVIVDIPVLPDKLTVAYAADGLEAALPLYHVDRLSFGSSVRGPALVFANDTVVFVNDCWKLIVCDGYYFCCFMTMRNNFLKQ